MSGIAIGIIVTGITVTIVAITAGAVVTLGWRHHHGAASSRARGKPGSLNGRRSQPAVCCWCWLTGQGVRLNRRAWRCATSSSFPTSGCGKFPSR
jgi:hypothetical protein